jgi:polyhydroxybutyrate depolymerase
VAGIF